MKSPAGSRARSRIAASAVLVDIAGIVATFANVHGPIRMLLGLALTLVLPGWAIIGSLQLAQPVLELSLVIAVSLATNMVAAQILMTFDEWHLVAFQEILSFALIPSIAWQCRGAFRHDRPRTP